MKPRTSIFLLIVAALLFVGLVAAQNTNSAASAQQHQSTTLATQHPTHKLHLPSNFSADDAYKQNCTRCHSEVTKVNERMTKTILRHMRVRANIPQDEARAILEYLNQ
jgi:hypothetical protein